MFKKQYITGAFLAVISLYCGSFPGEVTGDVCRHVPIDDYDRAVNVDMMLLQDLMGDNCELEMISGGCKSCHDQYENVKT